MPISRSMPTIFLTIWYKKLSAVISIIIKLLFFFIVIFFIFLIGFLDENERKLFQKLISVKGVGSKVAITILSSITIGDIIESVSSNNHNIIKQVPGIGDKTAKLILIQLQGQLDNISMKNTSVDLDVQLEATKAVEALGYQNEEIRKIINSLNNSNLQNLDTESLIRIIIEKISLQNQS